MVILGPSLGTDMLLFERQVPALLAAGFQVVRHDLRGHGLSPVSEEPFTLADMAADVVLLADRLGLRRFSFVGVSISGAIGQALAIDHPKRLDRLVLCATAAYWPDHEEFLARAARVRSEGTGFLVPSRRGVWYSETFAAAHPLEAGRLDLGLASTSRRGYAACCEAIAAFDARPRLASVITPTLIVAGGQDQATPITRAREIESGIAASRLEVMEAAPHLLNVECHREFNELMMAHLRL